MNLHNHRFNVKFHGILLLILIPLLLIEALCRAPLVPITIALFSFFWNGTFFLWHLYKSEQAK